MVVSRLAPTYDPFANRGLAVLPFIYIGFVKANGDVQKMGRLSVWIPEMGGDPADKASWIVASYASPFAGASDLTQIANYNNDNTVAQQSYGFWMVPPDLNNEVCVFFANGDITRAYWFACSYQQNMNWMVPGIAQNVTTEPSPPIHTSPVIEYNKSDKNNRVDSPRRPPFPSLRNGLNTEGLDRDYERGPSSTSARREAPSKVFGFLTPRGNTMHVDDNEENEFIRLRTRSGAQVLIHDTTGYVYICSKEGNSWLEISDAGIDAYTANSISMRAQGDLNIRADRNINLDADQSISLRAQNDITMEANRNLQVKVKNDTFMTLGNNLHLNVSKTVTLAAGGDLQIGVKGNAVLQTSKAATLNVGTDLVMAAKQTIKLDSAGAMQINSGAALKLVSQGDTSLKADGNQLRDGQAIKDNSGASPGADPVDPATPGAPSDASVPAGQDLLDTSPKLNDNNEWKWNAMGAKITTTVNRMPTHEPWSDHPRSNVPPPPLEDVPIDYQPTYGQGTSSASNISESGETITGPGCSFGIGNTRACSTEVFNAIMTAATKTGADPATMLAFADMESGFMPGVSANSGSATGLFQFINSTWNAMVTKYGARYNVSPDGIHDPVQNSLMGGQFIQDNAAILKAKGIANPTPGQLYIMHFMGSGGGPALIQAAQSTPSANAASLFPAAAKANPTIFRDRTVKDVYDLLAAKADTKAQAYANEKGLDAPCNRTPPNSTVANAPPGSNTPSGTNPVLPANFEQYKGRQLGSGECVALVQIAGGLPLTKFWVPGDKPNAQTPIGTPIATFYNGIYPTAPTGHTGFFAGMLPDSSGFYMVDQYNHPPTTVGVRTYKYSRSGIQNANLYSVVRLNKTPVK